MRSLSAAKRELAERWARPLTDADFREAFGSAPVEVSLSTTAQLSTSPSSTTHQSDLCESDRRLLDRLQGEFSSPRAASGTPALAACSGMNASSSWFGSWFGATVHPKDAVKSDCDDTIILEIARLLVPVGFLPTMQSPDTYGKLNLPFRPLVVIAANENDTTEARRRQHDILRRACILASHVAVSAPVLGSASSESNSSSSSLPTRGYIAFAHCPRPEQHLASPASATVTDAVSGTGTGTCTGTGTGTGTDSPVAPATTTAATAADTEYLNDVFHRDMTKSVRLALFSREWQGRVSNAGAVGANARTFKHPACLQMLFHSSCMACNAKLLSMYP